MKTTLKLGALIAVMLLGNCSAMKSLDMFQLKLGMTKDQAIQALGKKPENLIGAKQYDDGDLEVLEFSSLRSIISAPDHGHDDDAFERYWLYFFNDHLVEWGKPSNWQHEIDRVYRKHHRNL